MKESSKRARLEIVQSGLNYILNQSDKSITRKDFFNMTAREADPKRLASYLRELSTKPWQVGVLDRLTAAGLIEVDKSFWPGEVKFKVADYEGIGKILADHKAGGLILSHYLFPNEVPMSAVIDNIDSKDVSIVPAPKDMQEVDFGDLLSKLLIAVADVKSEQNALRKVIAEGIGKLYDSSIGLTNAITPSFRQLSNAVETLENKVNSSNKRIDGVENLIKGQRQVLDSSLRATRKISESVVQFTEAAGQVSGFALSLEKSNKTIGTLQESVSELVLEIKKREESKVYELARKLDSISKEVKETSELVLNEASKVM